MRRTPQTLLHDLVTTARVAPDRIAVRDGADALSYAELLGQASALAERLAAIGVGPGDRVAVELPPACAAVRAYVAVMLAGGAYVPVDVTLPADRRDLLVRVARASATVDASSAQPDLGGTPRVRPLPRADDVAYVIHTSGSTGIPKAVQMEHRNLITTIRGMDGRAAVRDGFVGTWWASPGFDAAAWEIWSVLCRGGTLVVVGADDRLDPDRFFSVLARDRVESCFLPPLFVPDFVRAVERDPRPFTHLRRILVGAEPIQLAMLQRALVATNGLQIVNGYGPAEAAVFCTLYDVPLSGGNPDARAPVGRPLPDVKIELDAPDAEGIGEIVICGAGVARGYLGDDPGGFDMVDGVRRYATGDLGRYDDDGNLVFCGRRDRQLKVRGFRIEAGEIEAALAGLPEVEVAVAGVRDFEGVGKAVVAYLVLSSPISLREVRTRLMQRLPYYALPQAVVRLERLPETANGKVDHSRLDTVPLDVEAVSTSTATQLPADLVGVDALAAIVDEEILGGLGSESMIAAGLTSLGAARIARRIHTRLGREISAERVLRAASWQELSRMVVEAPPARGARDLDEHPAGPLSFDAQLAGMWFHEQLLGRPDAYRQAVAFRLRDGVDVARLARSLEDVLASRAIFSAGLVEVDGVPGFELGRLRPTCTIEEDARPFEDILDEVAGAVSTDGLLWRAHIASTVGDDRILVMVWHHLVVDYWTVQQVLAATGTAYDGPTGARDAEPSAAGTAAALAAAFHQRRARERHLVQSGAVADRVRSLLAGADRWPSVPVGNGSRSSLELAVDPMVVSRALTIVGEGRHTLAEVLVAIVERSLCEAWHAPVVPYGLAVGDRATLPDARVPGCFVDTVLMLARRRLDVPDAVRSCAEDLQRAVAPPSRIPFALAVQGLRGDERGRQMAPPACFLALEEQPRLILQGVEQEPLEVAGGREDFGFTVFLSVDEHGCTGVVRYDDVPGQRDAARGLAAALSSFSSLAADWKGWT
ncbi:AMP-binding protein [Nocardioides sp.]|uniref:AMP-binding protein n=1 Tax=Nocardioides sp. TaxID=35761 RepID=UPI002ED92DCD